MHLLLVYNKVSINYRLETKHLTKPNTAPRHTSYVVTNDSQELSRRCCPPLCLCNSACHPYMATDTHLLPYTRQGLYASNCPDIGTMPYAMAAKGNWRHTLRAWRWPRSRQAELIPRRISTSVQPYESVGHAGTLLCGMRHSYPILSKDLKSPCRHYANDMPTYTGHWLHNSYEWIEEAIIWSNSWHNGSTVVMMRAKGNYCLVYKVRNEEDLYCQAWKNMYICISTDHRTQTNDWTLVMAEGWSNNDSQPHYQLIILW